jgi:adenylate cyclase
VDPDAVERKLVAILSADVVGYARLMAGDEVATLRTLTAYREEMAVLIRQHRGRVVDSPGDNLLAEFPSALDATRCAVAIERVVEARNTALPEDRRMRFRIGVHVGDVMVEGERIYGDGVNIAARIEGMADAAGICISGTVHEQVRGKLEIGFDDLGQRPIKNLPEPVHVYRIRLGDGQARPAGRTPAPRERARPLRTALIAAGAALLLLAAGIWATWPRPLGLLLDLSGLSGPPVNPPLPDKPSVVVLPFTNMSGDPEQEYFSDGITEELTNDLAQIPELFVIARNSAFAYKGRAVNVEEVGRELGVRYVAEGSVRRSLDRVRVTVQLIDATTGFHLWSEQYDRELADIFAVQSEISRKLVEALSSEIHQAMLERMVDRSKRDLVAYDFQLRATSHIRRFTREDNLEARRLLERAIERDPSFALAVGLLGATYFVEYSGLWNLDEALLERAEELARRALALDPTTPGAYVVLAGVHAYGGQLDEALAAAERAATLAPNLEIPHLMLALVSLRQGRVVVALQSLDRALRLNPRGTSVAWVTAAWVNLAAGRTEQAVEMLERERAANPDTVTARVPLAVIYEGEDRHDEAREVVREILRVNPHLTVEAVIQAMAALEAMAPEFKENLRKAGLPDVAAPTPPELTVPGFSGRPAIAVLPFDNLSGDPEQEYFADGIAEDLITRLSSLGHYPVIARNSSFLYRGKSVDVRQVSRELGVRYVVEGSVRRAGERVRINAQLIDATTGHHLWAETYDRELRDIFALQDEITEAIVGSIDPAVFESEMARAVRKEPANLDAYDRSLRGIWHALKHTEEHNAKARALFESATEMDPERAEPFFGLGMTHYLDVLYQWSDSPDRSLDAALRAAQRCAALDHSLSICHVGLAWAHSLRGQRGEAIAAAETAVRLNPSSADAHFPLGLFLALTGRPDDGIAHVEKAIRLSPQDPSMGFFLNCIALAHFAARRYEQAVEWEQRSLGRNPDYYVAHGTLAASHAHLGHPEAARAALQEMLRRNPEFTADAFKTVFAFADPSFTTSWLDGVRKAGLE